MAKQKENKQPRICYGLLPSEMADPSTIQVTPIIITEGESGYRPCDYKWSKRHAEDTRDAMNTQRGISPQEAERMLCASMFPKGKSKVRQLIEDLLNSADDTGCSEGLIVVGAEQLHALADWAKEGK